MSSLNILCAICSQYFKNTDVIYATRCGHVFHKSCLFKWLKLSSSCPQCRRHCLHHLCHQIYANFTEAVPEDNEMDIEFPKTYQWICADQDVDFSDDTSFAFMFGHDLDGCDIYAGRGRLHGDLIPGYYIATERKLIVSWEGHSYFLTEDIEVLDISNDDAEYKWVAASDGNIPEYAFPTGNTAIGDILYTVQAQHEGKILYGHQRCSQAFMPYDGKELVNANYEVLVRIPREITKSAPNAVKESEKIVAEFAN